jgi:hypothetical protein
MGLMNLPDHDWEAIAARVAGADGPIAWCWMAGRRQADRAWRPALLTVRGATRIATEILGYREVALGTEELDPPEAAARLRNGLVNGVGRDAVGELSLEFPTYPQRPMRVTTEPGHSYYLVPAEDWPQFYVSWNLAQGASENLLLQGGLDPLHGKGLPFYPSLQDALASLAFGLPPDQVQQGQVQQLGLIRVPDLRGRFGGVRTEEGVVIVTIDEGKTNGLVGCCLEVVSRGSAGDVRWRRFRQTVEGPGEARIETDHVPAAFWALLTAGSGEVLDRTGWNVTDRRPEFVGSIEARVAHLVTEGEHGTLEFKQALDDAGAKRRFAETVTAFANGTGGTVLVGVGDDGAILGFDRPKVEDLIVNCLRELVQDPVQVELDRAEMDAGRVWVVTVPQQPEEAKPFRCGGRVLVRAWGTTRQATTSEIRRLATPSRPVDLIWRRRQSS